MIVEAVLSVVVIAMCMFAFLAWRYRDQVQMLRARYGQVIDVDVEIASRRQRFEDDQDDARRKLDAEVTAARGKIESDRQACEAGCAAAKAEVERLQGEQERLRRETDERRAKLEAEYDQAFTKYKHLNQEVSLLEENLEDISFGLYKPHFTFQTSEEYKSALEAARISQRELMRSGSAAVCATKWTVGNSQTEGARMTKQYIKLLLRAFNGECDAAVANVTWNNVRRMEERIQKSFDAVNQLGGVMQMSVTPEYLKLKLDEVRLAHEYEDKRNQEREQQRRIREEIREEERAQREIDKAREQAEHEEATYERALEKARAEALQATGVQLKKLTEQMKSLEAKLDAAHENKQKAISRAQLTKSGFVYVISNVGSFGDHTYKIGMTRRMEPMDRITELGDASVPFPFDLHVMLYSDNAPELEGALHALFEDRRINLVNARREFYRDVDLSEIEQFVKDRGLSAQFTKLAEAKEYRESLALREQRAPVKAAVGEKFADTLFGSGVGAR